MPLVLFKILVKNHHFLIDQIILDIFIYTCICEEQFKEDYNGYIIKNIILRLCLFLGKWFPENPFLNFHVFVCY